MKLIFCVYLVLTGVALSSQQKQLIIIDDPVEEPVIKPPPTPPSAPQNKFAVVAANTIRRGKPYNVFVQGLDLAQPINVSVALTSDDASYRSTKSGRLAIRSNAFSLLFDTSSIADSASGFMLTVESDGYSESQSVTLIEKDSSIFIQTNKAIFKPLDLIQLRLFSIDSESNACSPKWPVVVTLSDPRNNEIARFDNVTFVNGKFEAEWLLSDRPMLGTWRLSAQYGENQQSVEKALIVDEYVLSLFTASLSVPQQVSYATTQLPITIIAEYTFRQPISGVATVSITTSSGDVFTKNVTCNAQSTTFFVDMVKELGYATSSYYYTQIELVFIDPRTNTKAVDRAEVSIVPFTYTLEFVNDFSYKPGSIFRYTVVAKTLDGKPAAGVRVRVQINDLHEATHTTAANGTARGSFKIEESVYLNIQGSCDTCSNGYSYSNPLGVKPDAGISLSLTTLNPSYNTKVYILATVAESIKYFHYFVTSKGVLLESRRVYLTEDGDPDNDPLTVEFSISPNFAYAPLMKVYAYYYRASDLEFFNTNLFVQFKEELPNYLKISPSKADATGNVVVRPGANVTLTLQSKAKSIVSLAAVDQRVLQLANTQNFTLSDVMNSFSEYGGFYWRGVEGGDRPIRGFYFFDPYQANTAGLIFITNIPFPEPEYYKAALRPEEQPQPDGAPREADDSADVNVRKDFREVYLFEDVSLDGTSTTISRKVPDSITTYLIFGVSMNAKEGMGLPDILPSTTIFLPFFVAFELPPTVKRGESFTITIQVFNYLRSRQVASLAVASDPMFDAPGNSGWLLSNGQYSRVIQVPPNDVFVANFTITPRLTGVINLKVSVKGIGAGDAVEKPLRVIPEGVQRSITTSILVAIDNHNIPPDTLLKCDLPASAYNDTASIKSTVVGDILGKALNNLDQLIVMPGGCGEQTMLGFVPDYAILEYLNATGQLTASLRTKLLQYLTAGYQNQLNYQRSDGSFSAFGNSDPSGSTWLTAYVARYFELTSEWITISPAVIQNAISFIIAQQNATDGSFNEPGRVIHSDMQGGAGNGIAMTAYVAIALATLKDAYPVVTAAHTAAIQYLELQLPSVNDTYALAVIADALQLAGSVNATNAFDTFYARRTETTTEIRWSVPAPVSTNSYYGARSLDIEVTAYGLKLLVARNAGLGPSLKVVKNLMAASNSFGGYSSSQDTVVALTALSDFALTYTVAQANVSLVLTPNAGSPFTAIINVSNSLVLQTFALSASVRQLNVHVNAGSTGVAVVSLICNFYEDPSKVVPSYNFTFNFEGSCQWRLQMQICPRLINGNSSNMAIMEVRMPSGYYYYDAWWLSNPNPDVSKIETYEENTVIVFYFNSVSANATCVTFGAGKSFNIVGLKPGTISINDYYDTSKQGSASFSIPSGVQSAPCKYYY